MSGQDAELDQFRQSVSCAVLLERLAPPWLLDRKGSTRRALKYRRGEGEIVIVNHDGRGWWDPQSAAKGDVFDLVQFLDPSLNFGQVRKVLRPFIGLAPSYPESPRARRADPSRPIAERWSERPKLRRGSSVWTYLAQTRGLPPAVLAAADQADVVREGPYGSAWFAHRSNDGAVSHIEIRGPDFKGSVSGGTKVLFRLAGGRTAATRLAIAEAPIDALSLAAVEGIRSDTLYLATGGGMGPCTVEAIEQAVAAVAAHPAALLAGATDANKAGERYADKHAVLAAAAGVRFERLRPPAGTDWNDVVRQGRGS